MPTILNILALNPNKRGIIESQLIETARALRAREWRMVCCFSQEPPPRISETMSTAGCETRHVHQMGVRRLLGIVNEARPDLVHLHFGVPYSIFWRLRRTGVRAIVYTEHSFRPRKPLAAVRAWLRHVRTHHVHRFIAVSDYIATQIRRDYLVAENRIRIVKNGVDLGRFRPTENTYQIRRELLGLDPGDRVIGVASHLHPLKRLDMLIDAMPEILHNLPRAHLVITGKGSDRDRLQGRIAQLGIESHARVLSGEDPVERIYHASDITVLPSSGEGLPGGAIEAMACGLPLVATPCGGLAEVPEDGISGYLVRNQTAAGLAEAILPLLENDALRMQVGRAARARAETAFDLRRTVRETIAVYEELLG